VRRCRFRFVGCGAREVAGGGGEYGGANTRQGAATTDVGQVGGELIFGERRICGEPGADGHDHAGLAVAALGNLVVDPSLLDWGDGAVVGSGQAFNCCDLCVGYGAYGNDATADGFAIDVDGANSADGNAAAEFGAGELEFIAKNPEEWGVGFDVEIVGDAVDGEANGHGICLLRSKTFCWAGL
jgi:hypothetical protein